MKLPHFALLLVTLVGCAGKAKPLAGQWLSEGKDKMALDLAQDGSFAMIGGNDFAAAVLTGKYEQKGDSLILHPEYAYQPIPTMVFTYKWLSPTQIEVAYSIDPGSRFNMDLKAPAEKTVTLLGPNPSQSNTVSEKTESVSCAANMKQLGMGVQMYANDYDQAFPPAYVWHSAVLPYVKTEAVFSCPTLIEQNKQGGYAFNSSVAGMVVSHVQSPETVKMLFETAVEQVGAYDIVSSALTKSRHQGTITAVCVDGHVVEHP